MLEITHSRFVSVCTLVTVCSLLFGCTRNSSQADKRAPARRAAFRGATPKSDADIVVLPSDRVWVVPGEKLSLTATTSIPGAQLSWIDAKKESVSQDETYVFQAPTLDYPCESKEIALEAQIANPQGSQARRVTIFVQNRSCRLTQEDGLTSDNTTKLLVAKDKSLFVGSRNGLTRFKDGKATQFFKAGSGEVLQIVTALSQVDSTILVGKARKLGPYPIRGFGVEILRFRGDNYFWDNDAIFSDSYVSGVFFDRTIETPFPEILAAKNYTASGGVHRAADLSFKATSKLLNGESIFAATSLSGKTYFGGDGGLFVVDGNIVETRFDGSQWNGKGGLFGMGSNRSVRALAADNAGNLWIGLQGGGIYEKGGLVKYQPPAADSPLGSWTGPILLASGNDIRALAVDFEDNLWIATNNRLVRQSQAGEIITYGIDSGLPSNDIRDVVYDDDTGNLWIATGGGVQRWSLAQLP